MHDLYAVAWKIKSKGKLVSDIVGHREISRAMAFFLQRGGKLNGKVSDAKYRRSPIAKGGLEIPLSVTFTIPDDERKYLNRMKSIVELNYDDYFLPGSCDINELKRNVNVGVEDLHIEGDEDEDDHIIDDEDNNDVICID